MVGKVIPAEMLVESNNSATTTSTSSPSVVRENTSVSNTAHTATATNTTSNTASTTSTVPSSVSQPIVPSAKSVASSKSSSDPASLDHKNDKEEKLTKEQFFISKISSAYRNVLVGLLSSFLFLSLFGDMLFSYFRSA